MIKGDTRSLDETRMNTLDPRLPETHTLASHMAIGKIAVVFIATCASSEVWRTVVLWKGKSHAKLLLLLFFPTKQPYAVNP